MWTAHSARPGQIVQWVYDAIKGFKTSKLEDVNNIVNEICT